jgi:putative transposase
MPSRNIIKRYKVDAYYHIYNRGVEKRKIFIDDEDYSVFINLFKRYLSDNPVRDNKGREYNWLARDVELIAFCLMPNHFHLLLYQINMDSITELLRSVCSAYTTYFNKKYNRIGPLFQGNFKASNILNDNYLMHITRYIHRNPQNYMVWKWSSLPYWLNDRHAEWVNTRRLNIMTPDQYKDFIDDEEDYNSSFEIMGNMIVGM